jgi:hypothetical protein
MMYHLPRKMISIPICSLRIFEHRCKQVDSGNDSNIELSTFCYAGIFYVNALIIRLGD